MTSGLKKNVNISTPATNVEYSPSAGGDQRDELTLNDLLLLKLSDTMTLDESEKMKRGKSPLVFANNNAHQLIMKSAKPKVIKALAG